MNDFKEFCNRIMREAITNGALWNEESQNGMWACVKEKILGERDCPDPTADYWRVATACWSRISTSSTCSILVLA
jgi:hypothetical protein